MHVFTIAVLLVASSAGSMAHAAVADPAFSRSLETALHDLVATEKNLQNLVQPIISTAMIKQDILYAAQALAAPAVIDALNGAVDRTLSLFSIDYLTEHAPELARLAQGSVHAEQNAFREYTQMIVHNIDTYKQFVVPALASLDIVLFHIDQIIDELRARVAEKDWQSWYDGMIELQKYYRENREILHDLMRGDNEATLYTTAIGGTEGMPAGATAGGTTAIVYGTATAEPGLAYHTAIPDIIAALKMEDIERAIKHMEQIALHPAGDESQIFAQTLEKSIVSVHEQLRALLRLPVSTLHETLNYLKKAPYPHQDLIQTLEIFDHIDATASKWDSNTIADQLAKAKRAVIVVKPLVQSARAIAHKVVSHFEKNPYAQLLALIPVPLQPILHPEGAGS